MPIRHHDYIIGLCCLDDMLPPGLGTSLPLMFATSKDISCLLSALNSQVVSPDITETVWRDCSSESVSKNLLFQSLSAKAKALSSAARTSALNRRNKNEKNLAKAPQLIYKKNEHIQHNRL